MALIDAAAHPRGLYILFFAELWERFSFYGMRALLVLYMVRELDFTDARAYGIYGAYGALVYTTPVIGGWLADRLLGFQQAIILGAGLMAIGHFCMAVQHPAFFYGALALLIVGSGLFKPNVSSLVGALYDAHDTRRDAGFTIFYMGINIGAFLAPLVCGYIGNEYGWHYGFGLAGIGMVTGLIVFLAGRHRFEGKGLPPLRHRSGRSPGGMWNARSILYAAIVLAVPVLALLVLQSIVTGMLLLVVGTAALGWIGYTAFHSEPVQRDRLLVIVALMFFHMVFWACFEQAGSSINLFTARNVERTVFDWTIPAAMFQSVNPLYIILLAPLFSGLWLMLGRRRREPSTPVKFALGILLLAAGFGALAAGAAAVGADGRTSLLWLLLGYFFITTGELCLSPVGLAMVTRLAPGRIVGAIMGAWFLSVAFAHYLAALIAKLASVPRTDTGTLAAIETAPIYGDVFLKIALVAAGISFALFLIAPWLKARMHEKSDAGPRLAGAGSASGAQ